MAGPIKIRLVGKTANVKGKEYTFDKAFKVGREDAADLHIPLRPVSRKHAELFFERDAWWVRDVGSSNGVFVNKRRIPAAVSLPETCELAFSEEVVFSVYLEESIIADSILSDEGTSTEEEMEGTQESWPVFPTVEETFLKERKSLADLEAKYKEKNDSAKSTQSVVSPEPEPGEPINDEEDDEWTEEALKKNPEMERRLAEVRETTATDLYYNVLRYTGNNFFLRLSSDWTEKTVYTFEGPEEDDLLHTVTLTHGKLSPGIALQEFSDFQVRTMEQEVKGCRLLKREGFRLGDGRKAHKAAFVWYPTEEREIYQHHVYVVHEQKGYTLAANFTKKTRKTIGLAILRMMESFSLLHE